MDVDQSADCCVLRPVTRWAFGESGDNLASNVGPISTGKSAYVYECIPFIWPYNGQPVEVIQEFGSNNVRGVDKRARE
jgi:hypothetical protein